MREGAGSGSRKRRDGDGRSSSLIGSHALRGWAELGLWKRFKEND